MLLTIMKLLVNSRLGTEITSSVIQSDATSFLKPKDGIWDLKIVKKGNI